MPKYGARVAFHADVLLHRVLVKAYFNSSECVFGLSQTLGLLRTQACVIHNAMANRNERANPRQTSAELNKKTAPTLSRGGMQT